MQTNLGKMIQFIVFLIIQILFIPLAIVGFVAAFYRELIISKKLGVSFMAVQVLQYRWLMHYFKSRDDEASVKLVKAIPTESHYGLLGVIGPAIIANRICGYKPFFGSIPEPGKETMFNFPNSRTVYFDRIMEKNVDQVEQVVIMGAGFDLRVLKYTKGKKVKVFELDQQNTQDLKIKSLKKAGIVHDWITFVPIDFNQESWAEKLVEFGFDPSKRHFIFGRE